MELSKLNKKVLVITNNQTVYDQYKDKFNIRFFNCGYYEILKTARDLIHLGYELVTHPLLGSIKPNETPYRSIILKQCSGIDYQSVEIIEQSLETYEKFAKNNPLPKWSQDVLADFQFIDKKLFESSLDSIILYI